MTRIPPVHATRRPGRFALALLVILTCDGCGDDTPPPLPTGSGAKGSAESIFRSMQKDAPKVEKTPAAAKP